MTSKAQINGTVNQKNGCKLGIKPKRKSWNTSRTYAKYISTIATKRQCRCCRHHKLLKESEQMSAPMEVFSTKEIPCSIRNETKE